MEEDLEGLTPAHRGVEPHVESPPMTRRSVLRFAALLAATAFLLPLAVVACSCADCLWAGCCPDCCPCCVQCPSVLTASVQGSPHPVPADAAPRLLEDRSPTSPPGDIFHVPKLPLV